MDYLHQIFHKAINISLTLFKLMIPIIIIIKILEELGLVVLLSDLLAPLMEMIGLPGAMGLVWATAMVTNLYGGLVVYASLAADVPMTVAQVTIVSCMMLIAHALPIEARIAQKSGVNITLTLLLRFSMAIVFAIIFNQIYVAGNWLQQPAELLWSPAPLDSSLLSWAKGQLLNLGLIFMIVLALVLLLDVLKRIGVIQWINERLRPVLHLLGIGREAETITLVGLTLGISYGGALLIEEARAGHIKPLDVLYSISLLGLSHSLIEDTLLMMLIGADLSGILLGRLIFTLAIIFLMVRFVKTCSEQAVQRYMVKSVS
jgi:spore maturation protein SpmB